MTGDSSAGHDSLQLSVRRGGLVPDAPQLSICILVLYDTALALDCLESLRRPGACPPDTELVVVANGTPSDRLAPLMAQDDVVVVVSEDNLGFAGGCNQAASVARAPLLLFLNDDSTVEVGCVGALVAAAATDPALGAVGARILWADGTLQEAGSVLWADGSGARVGEGLPPGSTAYGEPRDVDYASANGMLVTRSAWDAVGGFDDRFYPAYFEDVDLCLTLRARGFRIRYEPGARLIHRESQSTTSAFRAFLLTRNQRLLVEKWGPTLEGFEPRPQKQAGREFDAAVRRAVAAAASRGPMADAAAAPAEKRGRHQPVGLAQEADALQTEYHAYLEERVAEGDQRLAMLETYLLGLRGVRVRRWLGGHLARRRA